MADTTNLGLTSNPYLDQQIQDSLGDTTRAYNLSAQPAFNAAMVNSGSFGNEGVNQMNQEGQRQLQTSLGRQANDMRSNNYWTGMNFDMNNYNNTFTQNQQNFQNALSLLNIGNSASQQNLGFGTQIQNTPMNYYSNFSNSANSIGQGYGNSTTSATGSPLLGALGGAQLGNTLYKSWAGSGGGGYGASPTNYGDEWNASGTQGGTMNNPSAYVAPSY